MLLREVEVRHWRGLSRSLASLSPRLNLILGPNESGKSRFYQALHYGLFEPYKGNAAHKLSLQSWTRADSPFVAVSFSVNGIDYQIQKQFLKGSFAMLSGGGKTLKGEEAEESLRALLGIRSVGSKGAGVDDLGIWPVVMVPQGDSRKALREDINEDGRVRLQEHLSREIGVAAISAAGQKLLALAEAEYFRFFTAGGSDGSALRTVRASADSATQALAVARETLARQEEVAASLANSRADFVSLDGRLRAARSQAETARATAAAAGSARMQLTVAEGTQRAAEQRKIAIGKEKVTREEADAAVTRLGTEATAIDATIKGYKESAKGFTDKQESAAQDVSKAEGEIQKIRAQLDAARRVRRRSELVSAETSLADRLARIGEIELAITAARKERAALPNLDAAILANLRKLERAVHEASAKVQGAAVTVSVEVRQAAVIDGAPRQAGEVVTFEIVGDRRFGMGEIAEIEVKPGGGGLGKLRDAQYAAETALKEALGKLGIVETGAAADSFIEIQRLDSDIAQKQSETTALCQGKPNAQLREDLDRVQAEMARLGAVVASDRSEEELEQALEKAEQELAPIKSARETADAALAELRVNSASKEAEGRSKRDERDRLIKLYEGRPSVGDITALQETAETEVVAAARAVAEARQQFEACGGNNAVSDADRLQRAADALQSRAEQSRSNTDLLQGQMQSMLELGSFEVVQTCEAEAERLQQALIRVERQAETARTLWTVLREERAKVVEKLAAPVIARVRPYLNDVFPGSALSLGDGMDFTGLRTGDLEEPFEYLSGGAQEQLSLLCRIGLAEVLAGEGTLPLVLDDALVNTDPKRIARIHRTLFRAAAKLQVILFSCHDVLFDQLGADSVITLDATRI